MFPMSDYLRRKIREARADVHSITAQLAAANARLEAYEDALMNAEADEAKAAEKAAPVAAGVRAAQIRGKWARVLAKLIDCDTFNLQDVSNAAAEIGFVVSNTNVRSQLSGYAKSGLVDRVSNGRYRANVAALAIAGISKLKGPDVGASGPSDMGRGAGSQGAAFHPSPAGSNPVRSTTDASELGGSDASASSTSKPPSRS